MQVLLPYKADRAREKPPAAARTKYSGGLLAKAQDSELKANLGRQLKKVATTMLRPDLVLTSETIKQELTVLWEKHLEEANERKRVKCT